MTWRAILSGALFLGAAGCGGGDLDRSHVGVLGSPCAPRTTPYYEPDPEKWDVSWLWAKLEPELADAKTDAERAEKIARWVALSSVNDRDVAADQAPGEHLRAIPFYGLCGERSVVTKQLARRAGLRAEIFGLYNFIEPGSGHTTVQFCYDDDWHFFDVTYAGMFVADGEVMSFDRIRADPWRALAGLVPYETGFDVYQSEDPNRDERDYEARMRSYYSAESIVSTPSLSFFGAGEEVPLDVKFDLSRAPLIVGRPGAFPTEVHWSGADQGISERMGVMLGHTVENFQPRLVFTNATVGEHYAVTFQLRRATSAGLELSLLPVDVALESDDVFVTTEAMTGYPEPAAELDPFPVERPFEPARVVGAPDDPGRLGAAAFDGDLTWTIRFEALRRSGAIAIRHAIPHGEGLIVERVEVGRASPHVQ